jgi:hypothetical protein
MTTGFTQTICFWLTDAKIMTILMEVDWTDTYMSILDCICSFLCSLSCDLNFILRGLVRNLYPQHGHHNPSHFINISQIWQRFWPMAYRPIRVGFCALWRIHIPLQVICVSHYLWGCSHGDSCLNNELKFFHQSSV